MKAVIVLLFFCLMCALPKAWPNTLTITKCTNCTSKELEFIRAAEKKMNEVIQTPCFRSALEKEPLIQTNGKTPAQVVDSMVEANVVIDTEMYWTIKRVLGYTLPTANKEWINRRYMKGWGVCELGSLLSHETSHKKGYDHDYQPTKRRQYSVPYSINRAFKACCRNDSESTQLQAMYVPTVTELYLLTFF